MAQPSVFYHGFSTSAWLTSKRFGTSNIETVKRDLYNHIMTPVGERVMMPTFGTRIPSMAFEPNDEYSRKVIYDDIKTVIDYDPRVQLIDLQVLSVPDNNAIVALADVYYLEFKVKDTLHIDVPTAG